MSEQNNQSRGPQTTNSAHTASASQLNDAVQQILETLRDSTIAKRICKDTRSAFWTRYLEVAGDYDDDLIERLDKDMDICLLFAGLFSAISSAFILDMQSDLSPPAADTTNALLELIYHTIQNNSSQTPIASEWTGPTPTIICAISLAYASLMATLLAALGATLGKQWLGYFKSSVRSRLVTIEERGRR
ncbi:hypothetical protein EDB19DRAFT_227234, partial [Suillus lakei]